MNRFFEYLALVATLAAVVLGFYIVPNLVDENARLQDDIAALERTAEKRERLIEAQARMLGARPVVYRTRTVYKEVP